MNRKTAAVLGASPKAESYGNMALRRLRKAGYPVIPVNPAYDEVEGIPCMRDIPAALEAAGEGGIHTLTLYVGPSRSEGMMQAVVQARPGRVIFNPGTESAALQEALDRAGIPWLEACTLVLLSTNQY